MIGLLGTMGMPSELAACRCCSAGSAAYGLWLQWFLARHGLALGRLPRRLLVLLVNLGTAALLLVPRLLLGWG